MPGALRKVHSTAIAADSRSETRQRSALVATLNRFACKLYRKERSRTPYSPVPILASFFDTKLMLHRNYADRRFAQARAAGRGAKASFASQVAAFTDMTAGAPAVWKGATCQTSWSFNAAGLYQLQLTFALLHVRSLAISCSPNPASNLMAWQLP